MGSLFGSGPALSAPNIQVPEDERRQLTVLFYDIVGSTQMLQSVDPEDMRGALMRVHEVARAQISANSGTLEQVLGDGGMAYFGFPQPHEDAVWQSVKAAWGILQARQEMAAAGQSIPDIRIGIATSIVVLSSDAGSLKKGGLGAVGVAPNLSARLQSSAAPNTALVDRATYKLCGPAFEFEQIKGLNLKGFPDVESAYAITAQNTLKSRFDRRTATGSELIGRKIEMETLRRAWMDTVESKGSALLLKGEAGLGKSHLCHAVTNLLDPNALVLSVQCEPSTATGALQPLITMYEHEFASRDPDDPRAKAAVKTAALVRAAQDDPDLSADARRSAIVDGCADVLLDLTATAPCLVLAEDLHWVDEVTLAILQAVASKCGNTALMIVATARPETDLAHLSSTFQNLDLSPFSPAETETLVQAIAQQVFSSETLDWIIAKSDGNPLFAVELAKFIEDEGIAWRADEDLAVESLRDLLAARLETAGRSKRTAQIASILGRDVPLDLLSKLVEGHISTSELDADLDRLVEHGIKDMLENGQAYAFRHVLMCDTAYESQLRSARRVLHGRVVDMIETIPTLAASIPLSVLAEHYILADRLEIGITKLIDAAELAISRSALSAPRKSLERALKLVETLDDPNTARLIELRAISLLGPLVTLLDGPRMAAPLYERGQDLCFELEPGARGAWFPILWGWWFTASDLIEQAKRSEALMGSITLSDSNEARLQALHCGWATMFDLGEHDGSLAAVREGLALYNDQEAERSRLRYGHDAKVCGLGETALSLWMQGDGAGSLEAITEALDWAEKTKHLPSLLHALDIANTAAFFRRDNDEIKRILSRIVELSGAEASPAMAAKVRIFEAWFAALSGDTEAHAKVLGGLAILRDLGVLEDTPIYADIAAETAALCGVPEQAIADLDVEIAEAKHTKLLFWVPELLRRKALLANLVGQADDPVQFLDEGLKLALAQNANMLVLRNIATRLELGLDVKKHDAIAERIKAVNGAVERDDVLRAMGL